MADIETSNVNTEETVQENTAKSGDRLAFVHELIEVLAGSIALIAPAILLVLWLYRVGICIFYNLPIFYSSLNIIRFLPVIVIAVVSVMYFWFLDTAHVSNIISVRATLVSPKKEKELNHAMEQVKRVFVLFLFLVCALFLVLLLIAFLQELISMSAGTYPLLFKNGDQFEALLVLMLAVVVIIADIKLLILVKKDRINWDKIIGNEQFYASSRIKNLIIRISSPGSMSLTMKHFTKSGLAFHLLISVMALIMYAAVLSSYFRTNYYLVKFDDVQYAIVLDTDDYYIGEPIQIIQSEDARELEIHTYAYVYLDKAANPMVVRKESFDSITILRE